MEADSQPSPHADAEPPSPAAVRSGAWRASVPNGLTCLRVVMATAVVALLAAVEAPVGSRLIGVACGLFVLASLTDALDGALARRWGVVSAFGRVMDPFADKALVIGALVMLAGPSFEVGGAQASGVAGWMVVVILCRDLLVTSIRGLYEARGVDFSAGLAGKLKMIVQSVAVPLILLVVAAFDPLDGAGRVVVVAAAWSMVVVTVVSAWPYVAKAIRVERAGRGT